MLQLEKLALFKTSIRTGWVSAQMIVPKKPSSLYVMADDYRPINAKTVKNTLAMPHIDAVVQDLRGSEGLVAICFTSDY